MPKKRHDALAEAHDTIRSLKNQIFKLESAPKPTFEEMREVAIVRKELQDERDRHNKAEAGLLSRCVRLATENLRLRDAAGGCARAVSALLRDDSGSRQAGALVLPAPNLDSGKMEDD